ncbi:ADAMTS-like protein 1 isoform X2 [Adelges cooleyi]|uniref:ADAMTS-like protein 1 isoform X2 n=1 Tax=Adelges cooleyi TaxID=133065 RepID=UPI00217FF0EA|nr:ADAMTS-like protein 1 isoform X2 [Adelges cooleyi]
MAANTWTRLAVVAHVLVLVTETVEASVSSWTNLATPVTHVNTSYMDDYENSWSPWSEWSSCSRTCDGGAMYQLRRCNAVSGCKGHHVRYKICNMEPCPDGTDFRAAQCSAYNDQPYDGELVEWHPYYDEESPCTLMCVDSKGRVEEMAPRVRDGTRCRLGSLDMCIDGVCQRVGCNLEIGSKASVDECGVCGGDGSSCSKDLFRWGKMGTGCSVSCGGGYEVSRVVCQNRDTGVEVDADLCPGERPTSSDLSVECNSRPCPPKWVADDNWSPCSKTCGGGIRVRHVYCVEETNGTRTKVWHHMCHGHKPKTQEQCNNQPCYSEWMTGEWSKCSATCGQGLQIRNVTCKTKQKYLTCDPMIEPRRTQTCTSNAACFRDNSFETDSDFAGGSTKSTSFSLAHAQRLVGQQKTSSHTMFVSDNWGPCSVTCGEGVRTRKVYCKAHLDYTQIMTKLTDDACTGPKPAEVERCLAMPCPTNKMFDQSERSVRDGYADASSEEFNPPKVAPGSFGKTYSWKREGFTHCSASCLGGVQESLVLCVREEDKKIVSPYLCSRDDQPEVLTQTCNDQPCPPRWNVSEFQPCSHSCGIGLQVREVNCIHEVTEGNTAIVPNNMCPTPVPTDRKQCNMIDCPTEWRSSEWTKCSKKCNGGVKTRVVECVQRIAHGHIINQPDSECTGDKPPDSKLCNPNACSAVHEAIMVSDVAQKYEQGSPEEDVTLKVGGEATVYRGVEMKMRCPVKRAKIQWTKDGQTLQNGKKVRITKKGVLKIHATTYSDRGTYSCTAGNVRATMNISIKPRPGEFPSSEEIDKPMNQQDTDASPSFASPQGIDPTFDISHERIKGEHNRELKRKSKGKLKSTQSTPQSTTSTNPQVGSEKNALDDSPKPTTSGSSRNLPHLHSLLFNLKALWPFQGGNSVSNSRVNRMFMEEPTNHKGSVTTTEDPLGQAVLLGKGDRKSVKFEWIITEWSTCSPPCGGNGFQMRAAHCMVKLNNMTQSVDNNLCEDAGLPTPVTIQKCQTDDCPQWKVTEWRPCEESRCFTWNTAMQRRDVYCQNSNEATISDEACKGIEKPVNRKECYNDQCKGTWKVGEWTDCTASCEKDGLRYRILQCVWFGTNKPAGTACRDQPRPPVMKTCTGSACPPKDDCKDQNKHSCKNVKQMNMCHLRQYQLQCCQTCK